MSPIKDISVKTQGTRMQSETSESNCVVCLLRHATALKNLESRHGGSRGTALTEEGRAQVATMARQIRMLEGQFKTIVAVRRIQCIETSRILASELGLSFLIEDELQPIDLGVLDNLSDEEVSRLHPEMAGRLHEWRKGLIEIHELRIPGATNPDEFFESGIRYLKSLRKKQESVIIVGTRSVLLLLASILLNRNPRPRGGYREIEWPIAGYMVFQLERDSAKLVTEHSTVLPERVQA